MSGPSRYPPTAAVPFTAEPHPPYPGGPYPPYPGGPQWGVQAHLIKPREPAYLLYAVLLAVGGLLFFADQLAAAELGGAFLLSWVLVLLYAAPVAFVINRLDLFEREPLTLLAGAVIWGGVIATSLAAIADVAWLSVVGKIVPTLASDWGPAIVGPGVEEPLKLLGVVTLFLLGREEFDGILDGFVYGAMVGLGFTVVEDVSYFVHAAATAPNPLDHLSPVVDLFLVRVVASGLYGHVLFTGLAGIGFGFAVTRRWDPIPKRIGVCAGTLGLAMAAHFFWNSPVLQEILNSPAGTKPETLQWIVYAAMKGGPFLVLLALLLWLATRSEEATFRAIVVGEPADVISESEIESLRSLLARRGARSAASRAHGRAAGKLVGRLQRAQIDYAMIRSRVHSLDDPALDAQRVVIRSIRAQLAALPNERPRGDTC